MQIGAIKGFKDCCVFDSAILLFFRKYKLVVASVLFAYQLVMSFIAVVIDKGKVCHAMWTNLFLNSLRISVFSVKNFGLFCF